MGRTSTRPQSAAVSLATKPLAKRGRIHPSLYWYEPNRQLGTRAAATHAIRVVNWIRSGAPQARYPGERELFEAMHACAYRASGNSQDPARARQQLWVQRWATIRGFLVDNNLGLLYSMLARFTHGEHDADELRSEGMLGLLRAVDRFRPSRGLRFSTYACNVIGRAMARLCRRPKRSKFLTNIEFSSMNPSPPRADRHTELAVDRLSRVLSENLANLSETESGILASRFRENFHEELTFREIGEQIGLSKERIRQIQNSALDKIRRALETDMVLQ